MDYPLPASTVRSDPSAIRAAIEANYVPSLEHPEDFRDPNLDAGHNAVIYVPKTQSDAEMGATK